MEYKPNFYGPYSGKVKHVLNYLNGSYIKGYAGKDKGPFQELNLTVGDAKDIFSYIESDSRLSDIVKRTSEFLDGFYSDFSLELLSTIDFIGQSSSTSNPDEIKKELHNWNDRKRTLFSKEEYIDISIKHLAYFKLI